MANGPPRPQRWRPPRVRLTYADLVDRVGALAGHLVAAGLGARSRVLVALPNSPATVVAELALGAIGAVSLEVSREWRAEACADISPGAVVATSSSGAGMRRSGVLPWRAGRSSVPGCSTTERCPLASVRIFGAVSVRVLLPDGRLDGPSQAPPSWQRASLDPEEAALVLYTSGSTGRPHGVVQTHRNIDANSRSIVEYLGLSQSDRALLTLPLSYCYGRSVLQTHLLVGGSVFLEPRTAFPRTVLETIGAEECTGFAGVPLTFEVIKRQVDVTRSISPGSAT